MDGIFYHTSLYHIPGLIVVVETAIGLALFSGTFTWLAALVMPRMCLVFTLSVCSGKSAVVLLRRNPDAWRSCRAWTHYWLMGWIKKWCE
jgi:uncharacterized membrane protein YphA (DoxX/SURF4 family)